MHSLASNRQSSLGKTTRVVKLQCQSLAWVQRGNFDFFQSTTQKVSPRVLDLQYILYAKYEPQSSPLIFQNSAECEGQARDGTKDSHDHLENGETPLQYMYSWLTMAGKQKLHVTTLWVDRPHRIF